VILKRFRLLIRPNDIVKIPVFLSSIERHFVCRNVICLSKRHFVCRYVILSVDTLILKTFNTYLAHTYNFYKARKAYNSVIFYTSKACTRKNSNRITHTCTLQNNHSVWINVLHIIPSKYITLNLLQKELHVDKIIIITFMYF